jgi:hypothetical protein
MSSTDVIRASGRIGPAIYKGMLVVEGIIALFIAPMLTAGLASAEKEKDTFDFLRVTTLDARTFVMGCLLTTACFLLLIFACTLPILALTFIFGGVSMQQILFYNGGLFLAAMAISAGGVFISTGFQRSRSVHGAILVVCFIVAFFAFRQLGVQRFGIFWGPPWLRAYPWIGPLVVLILATVAFSISAARRLYEPNNRLFSYLQYSIFFALVMAAIGGSLARRVTLVGVGAMLPAELTAHISLYHFLGWSLLGIGVFLFSSGQVERGDEVWRLRLRLPVFQRIDERIVIYALYATAWIAPTWFMSGAWDPSGDFAPRFETALPTMLAAVALLWSATRLSTALSDNRGRVMIGVSVAFFVVWGILPAIGEFLVHSSSGPRGLNLTGGKATLGMAAGGLIGDFSPIPFIARVWDDPTVVKESLGRAFWIAAALAALLQAPLVFNRSLRRRLAVNYHWFGLTHGAAPRPSEATVGSS